MLNPKPSYAIIFDLRDVIFTNHLEHRGTKKQFSVIKKGLALLNACASQVDEYGRKRHKLYVLSNASPGSYTNFLEHFADIFALFDGIVMSAQCGYAKPDAQMYDFILQKYHLNPSECIFIDDKEVNVLAAKAAGMTGLICSDHDEVTRELKILNAL